MNSGKSDEAKDFLSFVSATNKKPIQDAGGQSTNFGSFPSSIVGDIRSYIAGNAIKRDISSILPQNVIWGQYCINLHNGIIKDVLFKGSDSSDIKLGSQVIGHGSTYESLFQAGKASALKTFPFLDEKGIIAKGNATAHSLKESVGQYVANQYRGDGVQVFGITINDGYHSVTLTYGKNENGELEYNLVDNGGTTSRITGHSSFKTAQELDQALNNYVRASHQQSYRVGRNKDVQIPAKIDVYEIYAGKTK